MRRKIGLVILGLFLLIDALAWVATYRAATAPSPEELQVQAGATSLAAPSIVEARGDGMTAQVSLNGEWRYRQTGSEGRELGRNGFAFSIESPEEEKAEGEEEEEK